jgi:hypothetical protein
LGNVLKGAPYTLGLVAGGAPLAVATRCQCHVSTPISERSYPSGRRGPVGPREPLEAEVVSHRRGGEGCTARWPEMRTATWAAWQSRWERHPGELWSRAWGSHPFPRRWRFSDGLDVGGTPRVLPLEFCARPPWGAQCWRPQRGSSSPPDWRNRECAAWYRQRRHHSRRSGDHSRRSGHQHGPKRDGPARVLSCGDLRPSLRIGCWCSYCSCCSCYS